MGVVDAGVVRCVMGNGCGSLHQLGDILACLHSISSKPSRWETNGWRRRGCGDQLWAGALATLRREEVPAGNSSWMTGVAR